MASSSASASARGSGASETSGPPPSAPPGSSTGGSPAKGLPSPPAPWFGGRPRAEGVWEGEGVTAPAGQAKSSSLSIRGPPAGPVLGPDAPLERADEVLHRNRGEGLVARCATRAQLERYARDRLLIGRLDHRDEVHMPERRPLGLHARAELLPLLVDLLDPLGVVLDGLYPLGSEGREHDVGGHLASLLGRRIRGPIARQRTLERLFYRIVGISAA